MEVSEDYFYVTLPSNSSMDLYPQNKANHFTTKLHKPLKLDGDWDVGLSEISYPRTWYNVLPSDKMEWTVYSTASYHPDLGESLTTRINQHLLPVGNYKMQNYTLPTGVYKSIQTLVYQFRQTMRDGIGNKHNAINVFENTTTKTLTLAIGGRHHIWMSRPLAEAMGLPEENIETPLGPGRYYGKRMVNISPNLHSMYVYSDLIRPRHVGDTAAPLLRTVPLESSGNTPENQNVVFNHIYFLPIIRHDIPTIEIDIRDDIGRPVPFEDSRLLVTLVFRRRVSGGFHW